MRKIVVALLFLLVVLFAISAGAEDEEIEFVTELLEDGTIEIQGAPSCYDAVIEIPSEVDGIKVTAIGENAFDGYMSVGKYIVPEGVTRIGKNAFSRNSDLWEVVIPDSVELIEGNPFWGIHPLSDREYAMNYSVEVEISLDHPYLEKIDEVLFSKPDRRLICYPKDSPNEKYEIPEGTLAISENAFGDCLHIETVTIPDSVVYVEGNPFTGCSSLKNIIVSPDHPYLEVIDGVLFSKPDQRLICYPAALDRETYEIPSGTLSIGNWAFAQRFGISLSVTIPDSIEEIGDYAFFRDNCLEGIRIPDGVKSIGKYVFSECETLTEVFIPDSVTEIGEGAFMAEYENSSLESVRLSENITRIEDFLFNGCSNLVSVNIPEKVIRIGRVAFGSTEKLAEVRIPENVRYISEQAFIACGLTSVVLPRGIETIEEETFWYCDKLESVVIPDSVTQIKDRAFDSCKSLKQVMIPDSVISIGDGVFDGCPSLTVTILQDSYAVQYYQDNGISYSYSDVSDSIKY